VYPDSLNPDPDPEFQVNPDPIRTQGFDDQKMKKKNTVGIFLNLFLSKNYNLLMSKLQEKPSALKRAHPALQKQENH
jgi:hypothetical protein